ncbi:MAG: phosphoesterase [Planctomycetes bacterium]|nr:phosphoesterase [Planctomycetota bacterium]
MTPNDEQVLVIPTHILHEAGLFQGLNRDVDTYLPNVLDPAHFSFLPRSRAEDDPTFKQLIPYVVLKHGDQVFQYTRGQGGGEKRLRALRSIGIGGHINPIDHAEGAHPYREGMIREVTEEVSLGSGYRETCLGFINDDSTPVGQVHLGIVHLFELDEPSVQRREADLANTGFAPIAELLQATDEFETWSQFVLAELARADR